jgi:hypothetical protein
LDIRWQRRLRRRPRRQTASNQNEQNETGDRGKAIHWQKVKKVFASRKPHVGGLYTDVWGNWMGIWNWEHDGLQINNISKILINISGVWAAYLGRSFSSSASGGSGILRSALAGSSFREFWRLITSMSRSIFAVA